jgi:3-oxoacyl-[acyl-carrier protein] reductase
MLMRSRSDFHIPYLASDTRGRYALPEGFTAAAAFRAETPASYMTGSTIRCHGGMIASIKYG